MPPSSRTLATRLSVLAAAAASVLALAACAGPAADESARADAHVSSTKAASPARPTPAAAAPAVAAPLPAPEPAPAPAPKETGPLSAAVQAQIDYALTYWENYNSAEYGVLGDNDCVNFASQTLIARGWQQDGNWFHNDDVYASSSSWRSSTAFRNWLQGRPDLARALDDSQRDQVAVGDIVQFDWDGSGDRDHTGVVTRVTHDGGSTQVYFAGHTLDSDYRSVDTAITVDHPGGTAYYWHIIG